MSSEYYHILEIAESCKISEIKKAYRLKAKQYHPDINKSPDAHDKFIKLTEAYEFLLALKEGRVYDHKRKKYAYTHRTMEDIIRQWQQEERKRARARAQYYARARYEHFKRSKIYKSTLLLDSITDFIYLGIAMLLPVGAIVGFFRKGVFLRNENDEVFNIYGLVITLMACILGVTFSYFIIIKRKRG